MNKIYFLLVLLIVTSFIVDSSCKKETIYNPLEKIKEDDIIIDKYLADSGIVALKSSSGLRYVIHDDGFGAYPAYGKTVRINYRGWLLDGTEFDNSFDNTVPFQFTVGTGQVISGMDEGIMYIAERGKITIYVPSGLAYGRQSRGDIIKANSILVFYIELLNVE